MPSPPKARNYVAEFAVNFRRATAYYVGMSEKVKIWFVEAPSAGETLLGRQVCEYAPRSLAAFDCERVSSVGECVFEKGRVDIVIPLDMPLVTGEDIGRVVETVKRKRLSALGLGEEGSGAVAAAGDCAEAHCRLELPHFVKTEGAKNRRIVYNQMKERVLLRLCAEGAVIEDFDNTVADDTVQAESGALVLPFCALRGRTVLRAGCKVAGAYVEDSEIGEGADIVMSHIVSSSVGARTTVGPFARLRGATVGEGCRLGDFVEVKGSLLHDGVKSAHLSYIGDAEVGARTNVGCGTVFCNYDGKRKHRTTVGEDCFIGANSNLVAPLSIGDGTFVAAGTTVTRDTAAGSFVIGRVRQEGKERGNPLRRPAEGE